MKSLVANTRPAAWNFVALQYCYGILNRTYIVFVTDRMICGAHVRGVLPAPVHVTERWRDPFFYPRPSLVAKYEGIDLESPEFTTIRRANFQLSRDQVTSVEFSDEAKWGMGTVPYSGRLFLSLRDGSVTELILLGVQDGPGLQHRLVAAGFGKAAA